MVEAAEVENLEFKWGKKRGIGGKKKDVQFYESFTYDGVEYTLYDCVYMYKEEEPEPYIGKLIKIWELSDKAKKVKVLWFFRPCEVADFLGNDQTLENELFLACGEGVGLVNINPLEAIAGKCNVVCISKDSRNLQPSNEELQKSDFVFYRTFDVGHRQIVDKMDEKVAGIEVKFIFNRVDHKTTLKFEVKENAALKVPTVNHKSSSGEGSHSRIGVDFNELASTSDRLEKISSDKTSLLTKVVENADSEALLLREKSSVREKFDSQATVSLFENVRPNHRQEKVSSDRTASSSKVNSEKREGKSAQVPISKFKVKEELKYTKDPSELDNRPSKRAKIDGLAIVYDDNNKNSVQKLGCDSDWNSAKEIALATATEDKSELTIAKESRGIEKGSPKRPKVDEKLAKLSNGKFSRASAIQASNIDKKTYNQVLEVTRRPISESHDNRSLWFKTSWEDRMQGAHEQGKLVLLENLDPSCTSTEVEDIIWHAFEKYCSAKMVQRNAISSPHSGQAYVIFKTREVAEMVVTKLDEGCLLLSNGRPLIGSSRAPCSTKKKSAAFSGHIVLEKLKLQMPRETREALSTSHCSQPNTLEYDMAMEWCLQQERSDRARRVMYKQQGEELRKLKAKLKYR